MPVARRAGQGSATVGSSRTAFGDFLQFLIGGCLFGSGGFLLANQVMVRSQVVIRGGWGANRSWGFGSSGFAFPLGTPGMGLLMVPLALGVCLLFAGAYRRWANLLVWASLAALAVGILNSVRMVFMPTTLWQLGAYVVMIAAGGGLMFRSLRDYDGEKLAKTVNSDSRKREAALRAEFEELKRKFSNQS